MFGLQTSLDKNLLLSINDVINSKYDLLFDGWVGCKVYNRQRVDIKKRFSG